VVRHSVLAHKRSCSKARAHVIRVACVVATNPLDTLVISVLVHFMINDKPAARINTRHVLVDH